MQISDISMYSGVAAWLAQNPYDWRTNLVKKWNEPLHIKDELFCNLRRREKKQQEGVEEADRGQGLTASYIRAKWPTFLKKKKGKLRSWFIQK